MVLQNGWIRLRPLTRWPPAYTGSSAKRWLKRLEWSMEGVRASLQENKRRENNISIWNRRSKYFSSLSKIRYKKDYAEQQNTRCGSVRCNN